jgi:hypothetical protein
VLVFVKAETGHPFLGGARADRLQNANGHHVLGLRQTCAQAHGAVKLAVVILGLPRLPARDAAVKKQRRVVDHRGGREAFFQCSRIDEGLEAGARLTPGLRYMVEFVFGKVKAAHQGPDCARLGRDGHQCAFHLGQLGDLPSPFWGLGDADQGTFAHLLGRRRFVGQARLRWFEAVARDGDLLAVLPNHHHLAG